VLGEGRAIQLLLEVAPELTIGECLGETAGEAVHGATLCGGT
jgi:hypothetical protein